MSNMSYCRFQNTRGDFRDCVEHIHDKLKDDEARARVGLVTLAIEMLKSLGIEVDHKNDIAAVLKENEEEESDDE